MLNFSQQLRQVYSVERKHASLDMRASISGTTTILSALTHELAQRAHHAKHKLTSSIQNSL